MTSLDGKINFAGWVIQFVKEESDRGIFARWLIGNLKGTRPMRPYFIKFPYTKESYRKQMIKSGCSEFLIESYDECWNEFESLPSITIMIKNRKQKIVSKL